MTITCFDVHGNPHPVAATKLRFSPVVYGILFENEQILLQRHPTTGAWQPPGRRLVANEIPEQVLRQHFRAVAGLTIRPGGLLQVEEQYQLDETGEAWHLSILYYGIRRLSRGLALPVDFEMPGRPEWVPFDRLTRDMTQFGYDAIRTAHTHLGYQNE